MDLWIAPKQIFDGQQLLSDQAILIRDGHVVDISPAPTGTAVWQGIATPGFIDLQVNGGGGALFNTQPNVAGIRTIVQAHRRYGTVGILPTVITDKPDVLDRATDAIIDVWGDPGVLGIHIEGPHLSLARRGTHASEYIRPMDSRTLDAVARIRAAGIPVMITVAPENTSTQQIAALVGMGALVSLGHTDADFETVRAAQMAGASCATHLFNAMSPMLGRAPGMVGAILESDCYAGVICDGYHVNDTMIRLATRAHMTPDRIFLVSDAMATVGGPPEFMLYGRRITLRDGQLINDEGSLAGAHVTQAEGVQRLVKHVGLTVGQALGMATSVPATCIGRPDLGQLIGRTAADVVLLDTNLGYAGTLADLIAPARQVQSGT